ncbi:MAG: hypothetical protein D6766_13435 [Verrucomicrobia bacterium]|nr:MAG: hypothetical protein D6766_13435 [Verrucomicrobiota bacterium]
MKTATLSTRQVVRVLGKGIRLNGHANDPVQGITYDPGAVLPGSIYVALSRPEGDGHDHVAEAVARGAQVVVTERMGWLPRRAVAVRVTDSRRALARIAARYYGEPARRLQIVGVTGPGSAEVAFYLRQLWAAAGRPVGLIGALGHELGDRLLPGRDGAEEPSDVQHMLACLVEQGIGRCVLELGSAALERSITEEVPLATLIRLGGETPPGVTAGELISISWERGLAPGIRLVSGRWQGAPLWQVELARASRDGWTLRLQTGRGPMDCTLAVCGQQNMRAALQAGMAARALGVPAGAVRDGWSRLVSAPGRCEPIRRGQPFGVWVDGADSPAALQEVLADARRTAARRLLVLVGGSAWQAADELTGLGAAAGRLAEVVMVTSNNPMEQPPEALIRPVSRAARKAGARRVEEEPDRDRAIRRLLGQAEAGDLVLLTGKGRRTTMELAYVRVPFDDRRRAWVALGELGWTAGDSRS